MDNNDLILVESSSTSRQSTIGPSLTDHHDNIGLPGQVLASDPGRMVIKRNTTILSSCTSLDRDYSTVSNVQDNSTRSTQRTQHHTKSTRENRRHSNNAFVFRTSCEQPLTAEISGADDSESTSTDDSSDDSVDEAQQSRQNATRRQRNVASTATSSNSVDFAEDRRDNTWNNLDITKAGGTSPHPRPPSEARDSRRDTMALFTTVSRSPREPEPQELVWRDRTHKGIHLSAQELKDIKLQKLLALSVDVAESVLSQAAPKCQDEIHAGYLSSLQAGMELVLDLQLVLSRHPSEHYSSRGTPFMLHEQYGTSLADAYFKAYIGRVNLLIQSTRKVKDINKILEDTRLSLDAATKRWMGEERLSEDPHSQNNLFSRLLSVPPGALDNFGNLHLNSTSKRLLANLISVSKKRILDSPPSERSMMMRNTSDLLSNAHREVSKLVKNLKSPEATTFHGSFSQHNDMFDNNGDTDNDDLGKAIIQEFMQHLHDKISNAEKAKDKLKIAFKAKSKLHEHLEIWTNECKLLTDQTRAEERADIGRLTNIKENVSSMTKSQLLDGIVKEATRKNNTKDPNHGEILAKTGHRLERMLNQVTRLKSKAELGQQVKANDKALMRIWLTSAEAHRTLTPIEIFTDAYTSRVQEKLCELSDPRELLLVCVKVQETLGPVLESWPTKDEAKEQISSLCKSANANHQHNAFDSLNDIKRGVISIFIKMESTNWNKVLPSYCRTVETRMSKVSRDEVQKQKFLKTLTVIETRFTQALRDMRSVEDELEEANNTKTELKNVLATTPWDSEHQQLADMRNQRWTEDELDVLSLEVYLRTFMYKLYTKMYVARDIREALKISSKAYVEVKVNLDNTRRFIKSLDVGCQ